ncbi:MAG: hypothetical protein AMJ90_03835 [candidate division Zixibacteria bacterium SM23_73_2]|nr:MAG: hypothetical protein AMJ90_03835 [candidate division Zixibacteria bacterium SM23_73_2]
MLDFVSLYLKYLFEFIKNASFYLLLGFLLAGIIHEFVSTRSLAKHLGKRDFKSILKASLIGAPLPLCSCGVIPTALALRKEGASKEATVAFLISTPETGVDSITISYALLDPLMTVYRPIAGILTSISAGLAQMFFGERENPESKILLGEKECCCEDECETLPKGEAQKNFIKKFEGSFRYGFFTFFEDIIWYIVLGFLIASLISVLVPHDFFVRNLSGKGFVSMLVMVLVGVPLYICSVSATPVASALILKGISPGAALVLLLVGPATNVATMVAVGKFLGKRSLILYITSIVVLSLLLGLLLNWLYFLFGISPTMNLGQGAELLPGIFKYISAFIFVFLVLFIAARKLILVK